MASFEDDLIDQDLHRNDGRALALGLDGTWSLLGGQCLTRIMGCSDLCSSSTTKRPERGRGGGSGGGGRRRHGGSGGVGSMGCEGELVEGWWSDSEA